MSRRPKAARRVTAPHTALQIHMQLCLLGQNTGHLAATSGPIPVKSVKIFMFATENANCSIICRERSSIYIYVCVCLCVSHHHWTLSLESCSHPWGFPCLGVSVPVTHPGLCDSAGVPSTVCWGRMQQPGERKENPALHPVKGQPAVPCDPQTPGPNTTEIPCWDGCRCWER